MSNLAPGIRTACQWCDHRQDIPINVTDFERWHADGEPIADVAPYLTDAERELLLTGTCAACYAEMIANGEDMS